jgi:hypothetical protein
MAGQHAPSPVSSEQLAVAQKGWQNFTRGVVISVVGAIGCILGLLAIAFVMKWL